MKALMISVAALILLGLTMGCNSTAGETKELIEINPPSEMFRQGSHTPVELLFFDAPDRDGPGKYYLSEVTMETANEGTVSIIDLDTSARVLQFHLDIAKPGLQAVRTDGVDQGLNDFVLDNYTEWCGKWHKGIKNYWKFCTGNKDCGGSGVVQWCLKQVDKKKCEQQNNCPTND